MKVWLGVIGRACLEFIIILVLVSFAAGASTFVASPSEGMAAIYQSAAEAAFDLVPLAALVSLFLAFFSFEFRIKNRAAGWLGLLLLGMFLFSVGIGLQRVAPIREALLGSVVSRGLASSDAPMRLIPAGAAAQRGREAIWIGSYDGGDAVDAVAVDFGSDYPRLSFAPRAPIDPATGEADIQGRTFKASLPLARPIPLVPEASLFSGSWIWDRLAAMDGQGLVPVFAAAGGFLLLAIGFRFLCRITGWPLANALLAAAGLAGLVALDAALSGGPIFAAIEGLARRFGLPLSGVLLLAAIEGLLGLILGAADIAAAPRARRRLDD
jgi:hypothetical protein